MRLAPKHSFLLKTVILQMQKPVGSKLAGNIAQFLVKPTGATQQGKSQATIETTGTVLFSPCKYLHGATGCQHFHKTSQGHPM